MRRVRLIGGTRARVLMVLCAALILAIGLGSTASGSESGQETTTSSAVATESTTTTTTTSASASTSTSTTEQVTTTTDSSTTTTDPGEASIVSLAAEPPAGTRFEQSDPRITYLGAWIWAYSSSVAGGSIAYSVEVGAAVLVDFDGTSVSLVGSTGPGYGKALVSLDGGPEEYVDLYSPDELYQQTVYQRIGLSDGSHTLVVKCVREHNAASFGYAIDLDALDIEGDLAQAPSPTRHQQDDLDFTYTGRWVKSWTWAAAGGTYTSANSQGAAVSVSFNGTYLAWYARKGPDQGKALVTVDGTTTATIDLYSRSLAYKQRVYTTGLLGDGPHTLTVHWIGQSNSAATRAIINVDSIDVLGTLSAAPPAPYLSWRYQQNDYQLTFVGPWYEAGSASASARSFTYGSEWRSRAVVSFTGTSITLLGSTGPGYGKALVSVDGGAEESVDFYRSAGQYQEAVYQKTGLSSGPHTLVIKCAQVKNAASAGYAISLDALDIEGYLMPAPVSNSGSTSVKGLPDASWFGSSLSVGSSGPAVLWLEQRLADLSYRPGPVDGYFSPHTRHAVIAFQKWYGLPRDGVFKGDMWAKAVKASRPLPSYSYGDKWIEVNKSKQVLLYCRYGRVEWTLAVSTGDATKGWTTPSGFFRVDRKNTYERVRYKPLYLRSSLLAIHGYTSVPIYPASNGCVRTIWADQDELNPVIPVGTAVRIY